MRARRHIGVLIRHDLRYTLSSARGLLFLVFFGLVWGWVFSRLAGGLAKWLLTFQGSILVSSLFDTSVMQLLHDRPATLAAYFVVGAALTPLFAMLGACDQTATDLGTRHIRFLIPRVGRAEIFVARLLGAVIFVGLAQLLAGIAATIIAIVVHGGEIATGEIIAYGAQVTALLVIYSLPMVALMSLVSAAVASVGLALLVGLGGYAVLLLAAIPFEGTAATLVSFLVPSGLKPYLLQPEVGPALAASAGALAYVALYACLGWRVFRTRDA